LTFVVSLVLFPDTFLGDLDFLSTADPFRYSPSLSSSSSDFTIISSKAAAIDFRRGVLLVDVDEARFVGDAALADRVLGVVAVDVGDLLANSA
jgi:hypothetical protein